MTNVDPKNKIFVGLGKKVNLEDFELELLFSKIMKEDHLISQFEDILVQAKIIHAEELENIRKVLKKKESDKEKRARIFRAELKKAGNFWL